MKTIASQKCEWTTRYLKVSRSGKWYTGVQNGGSRGSHQPADQVNGDWGFWHEPLHAISDSDAEALADEMDAADEFAAATAPATATDNAGGAR